MMSEGEKGMVGWEREGCYGLRGLKEELVRDVRCTHRSCMCMCMCMY